MARGNAGEAGNGGHSRSRFQSDGVLSRLRFDHQRDFVFGVGIVGRVRGFDGDGFDLFGGAFGLQRRGFGIFGNVGSQNVRPFIGRALFNWGGIFCFDWGRDSTHSVSDCAFAVAGSLGRWVGTD